MFLQTTRWRKELLAKEIFPRYSHNIFLSKYFAADHQPDHGQGAEHASECGKMEKCKDKECQCRGNVCE